MLENSYGSGKDALVLTKCVVASVGRWSELTRSLSDPIIALCFCVIISARIIHISTHSTYRATCASQFYSTEATRTKQ